ncbi:MAG: GspE/PulE family protein [Treponema sp.]|nr:GspE/PulE family protein [Treponema sp.]
MQIEVNEIPRGKTQYSLAFIKANNAIVLKETKDKVCVAVTDSLKDEIRNEIESFHRKTVEFLYYSQVDFSALLSKYFGSIGIDSSSKDNVQQEETKVDDFSNDAPTINLVNSILIDAVRTGASDIHIEAFRNNIRVRYRIDGFLQTVRNIEKDRFSAIATRLKVMSNLNILENRKPQDGRVSISINNRLVDLRISIVPIADGESIVLRLLGLNQAPKTLDSLGFSEKQLDMIKKMLRVPHGLILVTGPTGSGKTTTLNAMMRELLNDSVKIISIEDPIEYLVDGVNQIQVNEAINLSFDTILRRVLRQDPNIIMVGEIRDRETAELAVRAALTGHLVLSTLHTNDAISVISRLSNMGIEPYLLSSVLKGSISQRLVRKLNSTGEVFEGRLIISETVTMDSGLEQLINSHASDEEIKNYLLLRNIEFISDDAKNKIKAGLTTKQEIEREIIL